MQADQSIKKTQTDRIVKLETATETEYLNQNSQATMTEGTDRTAVAVNTDPPVSRHMQTNVARHKDKAVGTKSHSNPHMHISREAQTEPTFPVGSTDDVATKVEPWIKSAIQFLEKNHEMLFRRIKTIENLDSTFQSDQSNRDIISGVT
jgi:hypothetical protein